VTRTRALAARQLYRRARARGRGSIVDALADHVRRRDLYCSFCGGFELLRTRVCLDAADSCVVMPALED